MEEIKILIAENDMATAVDTKRNLLEFGYHVIAIASSGEEAVALASELKPNVVLIDFVLKGKVNGIEAAQQILYRLKIPVVFIASDGDVNTIDRIKAIALYGYITRPFDINDLRIMLYSALFKYKTEMESAVGVNRLKNELLANVSHKMRTPLNGIIGFAELLSNGEVGLLSEEQKKYVGNILSSAYYILQIVNDILDLEKIANEKIELHLEPVELNKIIGEIREDVLMLMVEKNIQLDIRVDPAITPILIDPDKLKQIFYCYLSNAIKFSHSGGKVEVGVSLENETQFRITIKDDDTGTGNENMQHIFESFYQMDTSIAKKYPGLSVELALVRHIVEAQGGQVGVTSALGEGSSFYCILPYVPHRESINY